MSVPFSVKGQHGSMPSSGFGTATLYNEVCEKAVIDAIRAGYRLIDTALLYNNQEAVGRGIRAAIASGLVTREELWVTSKVAFFPAAHDGKNAWVPIAWHAENLKSEESVTSGVDLCLKLLGLDFVDLMLIHNPCTTLDDYTASSYPHCFELGGSRLTTVERELVLSHRFASVKVDVAASEAVRAACWKALESARAAGKCRFIGVSNYSVPLLQAMEPYANVMPAVNQLELHPRFASPTLQAYAAKAHLALTAYGSGNSVKVEKSAVVSRIAATHGCSPTAIVLRWTLQKGIAVIPRTSKPEKMAENVRVLSSSPLSDAEMVALDALNEDHPYYWHPAPLVPYGTYVKDC